LIGLRKIEEATGQLIVLNKQLEKQKIVVAEKTLACEMILQEISEGLLYSIIMNNDRISIYMVVFFNLEPSYISGNINNFCYVFLVLCVFYIFHSIFLLDNFNILHIYCNFIRF